MALDNTTADLLANAICSALSVTDPESVTAWKTITRLIYSALKTDAAVVVNGVTLVTTGTGQSGPGTGVLT